MTIARVIASDTLAQSAEQHTHPVHLVTLHLQEGSIYLSDGPAMTYDGNYYVEGAVVVEGFTWSPDGEQEGRLSIVNDNGSASSLILNSASAEITCEVRLTQIMPDGTFTTPERLVVGVVDGAEINRQYAILPVTSDRSNTEYVPNFFFTPNNGFNWLLKKGTVLFFNNEKYVVGEQ